MTPNKLSIIIPSRNSANLRSCMLAIYTRDPGFRFFIADDGLKWPDFFAFNVISIPGIQPFCFSRNVNLGIKAAGSDDVVILNDDAILETPGGFSAMQSAWQENKNLVNRSGPLFGVVSAAVNVTGNPNQEQRYQFAKDCQGFIREDPRMVCFVAVFIPRSTIDAVGLLDESFTGYGYEDDDYCLRVRQAGLKIGIYDGCVVDHSRLTPTYRPGPNGEVTKLMRLNDLTTHNRNLFIAKHGKDRTEV